MLKRLLMTVGMTCVLGGPGISLGWASDASAVTAASARCEALEHADFSGVPDAPALVTKAKIVGPTVDAPRSGVSPGYCQVQGSIASRVGFELRVPLADWNHKVIELGCGGTCGSLTHASSCAGPLRRGYACVVSDGGHRSGGADMKWAYNNPQAVTDYLIASSHVTVIAGKAIVERFYGHGPDRSYFMGCSAGGIQALWQAQRFPWDFDGVVAGAPSVNLSGNWLNKMWVNRALTDQKGAPLLSSAEFETLHEAVLARCDLNDGIRDGIVGDPRKCTFDPAALRCTPAGKNKCLTDEQVQAVKRIYRGPVTSQGQQIVSPTAMPGLERTWWDRFGGSATQPTSAYNYIGEWFRYYFLQPNPGPAWEPRDFDFDRDYKRLGLGELTEPINNPDLRRFKARGGKLLVYTGWNDSGEGVLNTVDYYQSAEKVIGGRVATQQFFRLFVIPGMNHCSGGDGAFAIDYLSHLEAWVEKGDAPQKLIGIHPNSPDAMLGDPYGMAIPRSLNDIAFSRPIYPYPTNARYSGHGNSADAASFEPVDP